jgi:hypothetical protein
MVGAVAAGDAQQVHERGGSAPGGENATDLGGGTGSAGETAISVSARHSSVRKPRAIQLYLNKKDGAQVAKGKELRLDPNAREAIPQGMLLFKLIR